MSTAIEFNNISKQYRLGVVSGGTIRADFQRWWTMNIRRQEDPFLKVGETNDRASKGLSEYVWALKDIDFKVEQGDVVGIIGKNGAGKSTLLKILSRVTGPTTGTIRARGRIGSLLEVGTGFHPEMTGRENIFLNGAILGMTKPEIARKLDEIVDFSGCERYIDTPVKRYSSGMMVRLGFAVAAHLDPEILVVDEVLAVGDAEFQKKAIGKMQDVSKGEGRTVLFVSHNMGAVRSLCKSGILLENGGMKMTGTIDEVINSYISDYDLSTRRKSWSIDYQKDVSITGIKICVDGKDDDQMIDIMDEVKIEITYYVKEDIAHTNLAFSLFKDSVLVFRSWDIDNSKEIEAIRVKGHHKAELRLPKILMPGIYSTSINIGRPNVGRIQQIDDAVQFEVSNIMTDGTRNSFTRGGIIRTNIKWIDTLL